VFRRKAPDHLPRHLLYRMIAYHLQAERLGDLDRDTQRFLDHVAAGTRNGDEVPAKRDHRHGLRPGTVLVREWDGKPQRVTVLDQGFAWNGTTLRSLTEVAFAMTAMPITSPAAHLASTSSMMAPSTAARWHSCRWPRVRCSAPPRSASIPDISERTSCIERLLPSM
jgi:hypothetical protein